MVRNLEIETSLFCSNQMKIREIDHSVPGGRPRQSSAQQQHDDSKT